VIVLNERGRVVGAVVDSVSDVLALAQDQIKPAPEMSSTVEGSHIIGFGCVNTAVGRSLVAGGRAWPAA